MRSVFAPPAPVKAAQALFFVNAAIWLLLGIATIVRMPAGGSGQTITAAVIAILMFANLGAMLVAGVAIGKQQRPFYYIGIAILVVNIILTVTDQFGLLDFVTLVMDMVLLGLLIVTRARYSSVR
jgi:hypothetical protein